MTREAWLVYCGASIWREGRPWRCSRRTRLARRRSATDAAVVRMRGATWWCVARCASADAHGVCWELHYRCSVFACRAVVSVFAEGFALVLWCRRCVMSAFVHVSVVVLG